MYYGMGNCLRLEERRKETKVEEQTKHTKPKLNESGEFFNGS